MFATLPIHFADSGFRIQVPTAEFLISLACYVVFVIVPIFLIAWLAAFLLSLPMRRQERARFFLDLVETALRRGQPVEQAIVSMAESRDTAMGMRFHLLAAHLESGLRLSKALEKVPRFLPPQLAAMLHAGEELGDLRKVMPACRYLVKDAQSNVRGAASYLVVIAFGLSPVALVVFNLLAVFVFPKYREIFATMDAGRTPFFDFIMGIWPWLTLGQLGLFAIIMVAALLYIGGPRLVRWLRGSAAPLVDGITWRVPWKRNRMRRNFSAMLAVLLDGGVPEAEAVRLAGDCAVNEVFHRRTAAVRAALAQGVALTTAVEALDEGGEFRWRLANAAHAHGGFLRALTGWHEALDAKAFQQEQTAAHTLTSALILANGVLVALVAVAVFSALISLVEAGLLW